MRGMLVANEMFMLAIIRYSGALLFTIFLIATCACYMRLVAIISSKSGCFEIYFGKNISQ
jgi:hypothetical protein